MPMDVSSSRPSNKTNIFLGLIEYELNSLLGASYLVDYISVHIRFDLERYLLNICKYLLLQIQHKTNTCNCYVRTNRQLDYCGRFLGRMTIVEEFVIFTCMARFFKCLFPRCLLGPPLNSFTAVDMI